MNYELKISRHVTISEVKDFLCENWKLLDTEVYVGLKYPEHELSGNRIFCLMQELEGDFLVQISIAVDDELAVGSGELDLAKTFSRKFNCKALIDDGTIFFHTWMMVDEQNIVSLVEIDSNLHDSNELNFTLRRKPSFGRCANCKVGLISPIKQEDGGNLTVFCENCHAIWNNPEDALKNMNAVLVGERNMRYTFASKNEIQLRGWSQYVTYPT